MKQILNPTAKRWLVTGAILAGLTVALGAFGAHGLERILPESVSDPAKNLGYWETASRYQMYHCLGIIAVGFGIQMFGSKRSFSIAATLFLMGQIVFSGLLYVLAVTDLKILGAIVPLGGLAMIIGWAALAFAFWNQSNHSENSDG